MRSSKTKKLLIELRFFIKLHLVLFFNLFFVHKMIKTDQILLIASILTSSILILDMIIIYIMKCK